MPIFEFNCQQCTTIFEELLPADQDKSEVICPKCHSRETTKRFSTFASHISHKSETTDPTCATDNCCFNGKCAG